MFLIYNIIFFLGVILDGSKWLFQVLAQSSILRMADMKLHPNNKIKVLLRRKLITVLSSQIP